jgi:hypothetical protein
MAPMNSAGLRVFDVRNPQKPTEVAYYNPGIYSSLFGSSFESTIFHPRYDGKGHSWLTSGHGGFWVLEVEPQVRAALGLPDSAAAPR